MGIDSPYGVLGLKNRPYLDPVTGNYGTATGGTSSPITVSGVDYTLLTFTSSSTLAVTKSGLFDCLVLAGGGGGGSDTTPIPGGAGGPGGGGTGGNRPDGPLGAPTSTNGTTNRGGGAGGTGEGATAGKQSNGGSGIVIIRYKFQ